MFGVFKIILLLLLASYTQSQSCGQYKTRYTEDNGVITSPNYPSRYPPGMSCTYEIKAPLNHGIRLTWEHLAIWDEMPSCLFSSVRVYVGCYNYRGYLSKFCSKYQTESFRPHDVYSKDGCMKIVFLSSKYSYGVPTRFNGFKERFKFMQVNDSINSADQPSSKSCRTTLTNDYGVLHTPNWPLNSTVGSCKWRIKVKRGFNIRFNLMDLSIYTSTNLGRFKPCYNPEDNYLQINYTWYHKYDQDKRICGRQKPTTIYYSKRGIGKEYDYVNVTLVQNSPRVTDKLLLGYAVFNTSEWNDTEETPEISVKKWFYYILMYIIPTGVIWILAFCAKKIKQRQPVLNDQTNYRDLGLAVATIF